MPPVSWIARARPDPAARLRLFCVPPAGGGDAMYRTWSERLPPDVEVCAVRLPGRDQRRNEPVFTRLTPLVQTLADALASELTRPYAVFGHSMGARVAFELAREQRRRRRLEPALLVVSGRPAPQRPERDPLHTLSDDLLIQRLRRMGGTPEAVLSEPELMAMVLPIVRADLALNEVEPHRDEPALACPILGFGGADDDRCSRDDLEGWREHTTGGFSCEVFAGGHFFVQTAKEPLLAAIAHALRQIAAP